MADFEPASATPVQDFQPASATPIDPQAANAVRAAVRSGMMTPDQGSDALRRTAGIPDPGSFLQSQDELPERQLGVLDYLGQGYEAGSARVLAGAAPMIAAAEPDQHDANSVFRFGDQAIAYAREKEQVAEPASLLDKIAHAAGETAGVLQLGPVSAAAAAAANPTYATDQQGNPLPVAAKEGQLGGEEALTAASLAVPLSAGAKLARAYGVTGARALALKAAGGAVTNAATGPVLRAGENVITGQDAPVESPELATEDLLTGIAFGALHSERPAPDAGKPAPAREPGTTTGAAGSAVGGPAAASEDESESAVLRQPEAPQDEQAAIPAPLQEQAEIDRLTTLRDQMQSPEAKEVYDGQIKTIQDRVASRVQADALRADADLMLRSGEVDGARSLRERADELDPPPAVPGLEVREVQPTPAEPLAPAPPEPEEARPGTEGIEVGEHTPPEAPAEGFAVDSLGQAAGEPSQGPIDVRARRLPQPKALPMLTPDEIAVAADASGAHPDDVNADHVAALTELAERDPATAQQIVDAHQSDTAIGAAAQDALRAMDSEPPADFAYGPKGVSADELGAVVQRVTGRASPQDVVVHDSGATVPEAVRESAEKHQVDADLVKGFHYQGAVHLVRPNIRDAADAERVLMHERWHQAAYGMGLRKSLVALYHGLGGTEGVLRYAAKHGMEQNIRRYVDGLAAARQAAPERFTREHVQATLANELLAHIAQHGPTTLRQRALAIIGQFRDWLRRHSFATLAQYGDTDVANLLRAAERYHADRLTNAREEPTFMRGDEGQGSAGQTGINRATVEQERAGRGQAAIEDVARRSFGDEVWNDPRTNDTDAQIRLVDELAAKERPLTDQDVAMLLKRKVTLSNQFKASAEARAAAEAAGDRAAAASHTVDNARAADQLTQLENAVRRSGAELGRGLAAFRAMAREDYSLASLSARARAAKGGKALTDAERGEVEGASRDVEAAQSALDQRVDAAAGVGEQEAAERQFDALRDEFARTGNKEGVAADMIRNRVKAGAKGFKEAVSAVHDAAPEATPETLTRGWERVRKRLPKYGLGAPGDATKAILDVYNERLAGLEKQPASAEDDRALAQERARVFGEQGLSDAQRLERLKRSMVKRTLDLRARTEARNFAKTPRRPVELDEEGKQLLANLEQAKLTARRLVTRMALEQRNVLEKVIDFLPKWQRFGFLSGPGTFLKLAAAGAARIISTPLDMAAAQAWRMVPGIGGIAEGAPRYGGWNTRALGAGLSDILTNGWPEAKRAFRIGATARDLLYGRRQDIKPFEPIFGAFGRAHAAVKASVKGFEFEVAREMYRSYLERALSDAAQRGEDISDPAVQMRYGLSAYKASNAAVFLQDNVLVEGWKRFLSVFKESGEPSKVPGRNDEDAVPDPGTPLDRRMAAALLNTQLPIVKIPTNFAAEALSYTLGGGEAAVRLAAALYKGLSKMSAEDKDLFMRALAKGSIGAVGLTVGYLNPQVFGGYWQPNDKGGGHPHWGTIRAGGVTVPAILLHSPAMVPFQVGATIRHTMDHLYKGERGTAFHGAVAAGLGFLDDVPFSAEMLATGKLREGQDPSAAVRKAAEERLKDFVLPIGVQELAREFDHDAQGQPVARNPQGMEQQLESGIPGLRQEVPEKTQR